MSNNDVAVLGVGMHAWGKWATRSSSTASPRPAPRSPTPSRLEGRRPDRRGETVRNGYGGYVAVPPSHRPSLERRPRRDVVRGVRHGCTGLDTARARILAGLSDVALVVGADTTPKGFLAPNAVSAGTSGLAALPPDGMTNPATSRSTPAVASTCTAPPSRTSRPSGQKLQARPEQPVRALPQGGGRRRRSRVADGGGSLHLLDICATSDGGAAIILTSMEYARKKGIVDPVRIKAISTVTPTFPQTIMDMPNFSTESASAVPAPERTCQGVDRRPRLRGGRHLARGRRRRRGLRPRHVRRTRLDRGPGLCIAARPSTCCAPATRRSVAASRSIRRGLACFGEAVPAQALAQVCELTWQLRGQAEGRQVEGARVGITANQGLFGHGSS